MRTFYELDAKTPLPVSLLCGVQHVLAMFVGIITPPLIVARALVLDLEQTAFLVSMALFTSGVTTFVQVKRIGPFGSGLLSVQGTSFTFVPLAIQAGQAGGLPLIMGMTLAGAPLELILSRFIRAARVLFPPVVTGSVVTLIGLSLIRVSVSDIAGGMSAEGGGAFNVGLGVAVASLIVVLYRFGGGFLRTSSVALGLGAGYLAAVAMGQASVDAMSHSGWLAVPTPLRFGLAFDVGYLLPWLIGYGVTTIESIGDLSATSAVSRQPVTGPVFLRRLQGGVLADGLGSALAGLFNAMPNTTFSQNNGVISLTGVAARRVGLVTAVLLVGLGLFPHFAAVLGTMPRPVLGGATLVMFSMVALAGIGIVSSQGSGRRPLVIFAVSVASGLAVTFAPEWVGLFAAAPDSPVGIVLQSGLAVGALVATALNVTLPGGR